MRAALVSVIVVVAGCGDNLVGDRPPELAGAQLVTAEDTAVTYTLAPTNPEGAAVAIQLSTPAHGTVALADRQLTYTPAADYHGADSIVVTVSDGTLEATATLEITVTPVNDAPVAVADSFAGAEDTVLNLGSSTLLGNDTDVDGDALTVTSVGNASHGTVVMIGTDVRFTPALDFSGNAGFEYVVSDGTISVTGTVTIAVALDNDPPVAVDDTRTTVEDTALSITGASLLANDTDPEGQTLSIMAVTNPTNGTVVLAGGDVTFTPAANFFGTATFQYIVTDGADSDAGLVTITVTPVNDAPVAVDDVASTPEDVALAIPAATLAANDTDVDGPALSVTAAGNPTNGTVVLAGGIATFTPTASFAGTASFDYTISDGTLTDTGTVTITVTPVNDAPVAVDDIRTTAEDTPLGIATTTLTANDTDVDGPALAVTAVGSPVNGTVVLAGGTATFTPAANFFGTASFDYTVSDGTLTDTGTVTITVTPVNDAPVAVDDTRTTAEDTPLAIPATTLTANDTDVDGPSLTIISVSSAINCSVTLSAGTLTFTPTSNFSGTASFQYTVSDGTLTDVGLVTVTVTAVNDAPVAIDDIRTTAEDTPLVIATATLTANDTDVDGPALTVTAVGSPVNGTVVLVGGTATFTPAASFAGTASFDYTVSDGTLTDTGTVTITVTPVNDAPVAVDDTATTAEDTLLAIPTATLVANDTDVDGPALTVTAVGSPVNGTVVLAGGIATFTPAANFSGNATFQYTVSDGTLTDVGLVTISVTPVNDPPVAVDDTAATAEDTPLAIPAATLAANDTDIDGPSLAVTAVGSPVNGTVTLVAGTVTFTPATNFSGIASFQYTLSDSIATDIGLVTVTVTGDDDAPVAVDDTATTAEDTPLVIPAATLTANDTDADGPALTVTAVGSPINGTVVLVAGTITFTPAANFAGTASFQYTVSDGTLTDIGLVTITVTPVNDAPVAVADSRTTAEDTPLVTPAASLTANDTDVDGPSLAVTAVGSPVNGTVTLVAGTVTFTPAANFSGTASFQYTLSDSITTATGLVTVTVTAVNDAPVAVDDTATTAEDVLLAIPAATLTANDTDADGPALTVTAVGIPVNGTVVLAGGIATFTPAANFAGTASFQYTVSDGTLTDVGLVTITVTAVNDAPVAVDDTATTAEDTPLAIPAATLAANDTDVDGPSLAITAAGSPVNGTVVLVAGTVTFTPAANFSGTASFQYTLSDSITTATGLVTVTVTPVNDAPVAVDDTATTDENTPLAIPATTLTANDTDVDGPALTVIAVGAATSGSVVLIGATVTFTPATSFAGIATFEYTVSDGTLTDTGLVTVTVTQTAVCGDGVTFAPETCDDGAAIGGDGCSATCQTETGYECTGQPSVCATDCGDTIVVAPEQCDDGNANDNDGCTSACVTGVVCTAAAFPGGDRFAVDPATGHCYVSFDDDLETFAQAEAACVGTGGYLATITSGTEDAVVHTVQNPAQNPSIGAVDDANDTDGIFDWVTDETFVFTHFAPGQPDDDVAFGGNGECLHLLNAASEWNDTNCTINTFVVGKICEVEPAACGDSIAQVFNGEECDDGNTAAGDGCSATCQLENGCGNGIINAGEECDDDNTVSGDNCSATCQVEDGCGDGNLDGTEQCDDDNTVNGDGCSSTCQLERLIVFSFTGAAGNEVTRVADGAAPAPGLAAIPLMSRGTGVTPSAAANAFSGSQWTTTATLDVNDYYSFTVTPAAGFSMTLKRLELDEMRSATGIRSWSVRSSLDGFATNLQTFAVPDDTLFRTNEATTLGAAFAGLTTAVEFRIYGFASEAGTGTWRIDNVELFGFTSSP